MMEMVLQQSQSAGGGAGMFPGVAAAACRRGPSRPAATAPMMAKQEQVVADEQDQQQAAGEEEGAGDELRRGPWTVDEDLTLINYIADHGEGRWNALARAAGTYVRRSSIAADRSLFPSCMHGCYLLPATTRKIRSRLSSVDRCVEIVDLQIKLPTCW